MTHDPFQTHPMAAYSGLNNPFISPYAMQTSAINPMLASNPFTQQLGPQGYAGIQAAPGIPFYGGISPQQLQLASALASQAAQLVGASPFAGGWHNPFAVAALQNQLLQTQAYNPYAQVGLNPYQQPYQQFGQQQFGQPVSPFVQTPLGTPTLAPQSWVGQGQIGQPGQLGGAQGQLNPFILQAVVRAIQQTQGTTPWAAF